MIYNSNVNTPSTFFLITTTKNKTKTNNALNPYKAKTQKKKNPQNQKHIILSFLLCGFLFFFTFESYHFNFINYFSIFIVHKQSKNENELIISFHLVLPC